MKVYVGMDVSLKSSELCAVNEAGDKVWRGRAASDVEAISEALRAHVPGLTRIGLETGGQTPYLAHGLRAAGFEVVALDARAAKAVLKTRPVKTDKNDAATLAELVRSGFYRPVHVKSFAAHKIRALLLAREHLVGMRQQIMGTLRGLLRPFGLMIGKVGLSRFAMRVRELVAGDDLLKLAAEPLLLVLRTLCDQQRPLDAELMRLAKANPVCQRIMSVDGVGVVTALAYMASIDDPSRFKHARDVGPALGLTPGKYQSGEVERSGPISKWGDKLARRCLYSAANVLLTTVRARSELKSWGLRLRGKIGAAKAKVAVARKLATLLLCLWRDGTVFEPYPSTASGSSPSCPA